jgi:hypothetical protein
LPNADLFVQDETLFQVGITQGASSLLDDLDVVKVVVVALPFLSFVVTSLWVRWEEGGGGGGERERETEKEGKKDTKKTGKKSNPQKKKNHTKKKKKF